MPRSRDFLLAELLADSADSLRRIPQCETLGIVTQMKLLSIEYLAHVARITRIETHPRDVGCRGERFLCKIKQLSLHPLVVPIAEICALDYLDVLSTIKNVPA